jgi:hypothetical protein
MCTLRNCLKLLSLNSPFNYLNIPVPRTAYTPPPRYKVNLLRTAPGPPSIGANPLQAPLEGVGPENRDNSEINSDMSSA